MREARRKSLLRRCLQRLLGRPCGRVLYRASSREQALAWERDYFEAYGDG